MTEDSSDSAMVNEQKSLLTYKTEDGFEVNSLLVTPEFESEEDLYESPIIINLYGVLGHFLTRGTPVRLPPLLKEKNISTLSVNTRMAFMGQIMGEGIFPDTIHEMKESVNILRKEGFRNIFMLGYSLGANMAVYYASKTGSFGIKGLILEGCSYSLPYSQQRRLEKNRSIPSYEAIYLKAREVLGANPEKKKNDQVFIVYRAWGDSFNPVDGEMFTYRTWWFMRGPHAYHAKTCEIIGDVKIPVLFIHGAEDDIVDVWEPKELKDIMNEAGNEDVTLRYIAGAKHDCVENPEESIETIGEWVSEVMAKT